MNDTVRALSYANATTDTLLGVNSRYTVFHSDSILRTNLYAVAVAEAGVVAESITAIRHIGGKAGLVSLIVVLLFYNFAGAVTCNVSNPLHNVLCLCSEYSRNSLSTVVAAGNAKIGLGCSAIGKSLSVAVTSGETTGATVCTGQAFTDSNSGLVLLNSKEHRGNGKHDTAYKCDTG